MLYRFYQDDYSSFTEQILLCDNAHVDIAVLVNC